MQIKKVYLFIFLIILSVTSCDDGDIIISSFEFDDANLQVCNGALENEFVFFKINTSNNETISVNFISDTYNETTVTETPLTFDLSQDSNTLIYRQFNVAPTNSYFCATLPSSSIVVTKELIGISGIVDLRTTIVANDDEDGLDPAEESGGIDPLADADEDGIPNYQDANNNGSNNNPNCEDTNNDGICDTLITLFDADQDGIPNFQDQDDDNDNVLTIAELENGIPGDDSLRDSDEDMIPDYLDKDDDGDGINTIDEDIDGDGSPRDDDDTNNDGVFFYLDENATETNGGTVLPDLNNTTVRSTYRTEIDISNLEANDDNDNFENSNFSFGFRDVRATRNLKENP